MDFESSATYDTMIRPIKKGGAIHPIRRYNFLMNLLLLGAVAGCAFHPPANPPRLAIANGPMRRAAIPGETTTLLAVRAGSAYDPPGREGLARVAAGLAEHHGAHLVEFGPEVVIFQMDLSQSEALLSWLRAPTPSAAELSLQVEEQLRWPWSCEELAEAALDRWQFSGHPYRGPQRGRQSTLPTLTAAEVGAFVQARYVKDGMATSGTAVPGLDELSSQLSRRVTPAALAPSPLTTTLTLVVKGPPGFSCGAMASDAEVDPDLVRRAKLAWDLEKRRDDLYVPGQMLDLRVQRPLRLVGDLEKIRPRVDQGWGDETWAMVAGREAPTAALSRLLLEQPLAPHDGGDGWNQQIHQLLVEQPHRVVVVTPDVTEYLNGEGMPLPGVLPVVTPEDLFQ